MMEKGNYDGAISKLVKSLAGKKNKDQEKVIALEYAFKKGPAKGFEDNCSISARSEKRTGKIFMPYITKSTIDRSVSSPITFGF